MAVADLVPADSVVVMPMEGITLDDSYAYTKTGPKEASRAGARDNLMALAVRESAPSSRSADNVSICVHRPGVARIRRGP
jgi:hypothetical protein